MHGLSLAGLAVDAALAFNTITGWIGDPPRASVAGDAYLSIQSQIIKKGDEGSCPSYTDPTDRIMAGLNEMMFRAGVKAPKVTNSSYIAARIDPGLSIYQNVTAFQTGSHNIYKTNFWYFVGAAALELCCILLILPTYWVCSCKSLDTPRHQSTLTRAWHLQRSQNIC